MTDVRLTATNPEDSSVVPVACNSRGELLVEGSDGDYLPTSGGNLTGNLTLGTDNIHLDATNGAVTFASGNAAIGENGTARFNSVVKIKDQSGAEDKIVLDNNGNITSRKVISSLNGGSNIFTEIGSNFKIGGSGNYQIATYTAGSQVRFSVAETGDVVISSRNKQWMIVESNGLAHLVEQTRQAEEVSAEQPNYPPLRDIPGELTMVEQQLQKVMERLKMAPEAGWEVWDGSD